MKSLILPLIGVSYAALTLGSQAALVAYFPIDSATDTSTFLNDTIDDASHGVTDGIATGSAAATGGTIEFNAFRNGDVLNTADNHRYLAGTQDIDLTQGFAWSLWVNIASTEIAEAGADSIIGTRQEVSGTWHKMDLASTGNWNGGVGYTTLADDTWHHVVYTGDTTSLQMYIDGTLVATDSTVPVNTFNGNMEIGGTARFTEDVTGLYDDIAIYNQKLTQEQVTALFQGADPTTIPEPSTAIIGAFGLLALLRRKR